VFGYLRYESEKPVGDFKRSQGNFRLLLKRLIGDLLYMAICVI